MDVLLTRPVVLPDSPGLARFNDVGLGCVATACRDAGANVSLISWNTKLDESKFRQKLGEVRPALVGVKAWTPSFREVNATLRLVREILPDALTVLGGPHPSTSAPDDLFAEFGDALDFAVAGDGEEGMRRLLQLIDDSGGRPGAESLASVPGLVYRSNGRVAKNKPFLEGDVDAQSRQDWSQQNPSEFSRIDPTDNAISAFVNDSRGCPAQCGHCMAWLINGRGRKRKLALLCAELDELIDHYGVRDLEFSGNCFLADPAYTAAVCEWFLRKPQRVRWGCTGADFVQHLCDRELVRLMARAGCGRVHFGIESGSPRVVESLRKPFTLAQVEEAVRVVAAEKIAARGYFMFGFPEETLQDMQQSIAFSLSLPFDGLAFCICLPLPGTTSYRAILARDGLKRIDWSTYDFARPSPLPCDVPPERVWRVLKKANRIAKWKVARWAYRVFG